MVRKKKEEEGGEEEGGDGRVVGVGGYNLLRSLLAHLRHTGRFIVPATNAAGVHQTRLFTPCLDGDLVRSNAISNPAIPFLNFASRLLFQFIKKKKNKNLFKATK